MFQIDFHRSPQEQFLPSCFIYIKPVSRIKVCDQINVATLEEFVKPEPSQMCYKLIISLFYSK